jgi:chemosensory pili system protein ChpC
VNSAADEIYSLLIPLVGERLVVPRACVAEVVRFGSPRRTEGAQDWLLGMDTWTGRELPVVSYEGPLGRYNPAATGRTRIVVFVGSTGQLKTGYFGITTQGFPQLVRVNRDVLKLESTDGWPDGAPALCRVRMINEFPLIPDLEKLEYMLARESIQA